LPQTVVLHAVTHVLFEQYWFAGQALLQPPQCCGSTFVSTHAPPHATVPAPQTKEQTPCAQSWFVGQTAPQAPQFSASLDVFTQRLPQSVVPPAHPTPQTPFEHDSPAPQALPQVPQFIGSLSVLMQLPLQIVPAHV
jgi:hypothetical protein